MFSAYNTLQWLMASALAVSLSVAPVCAPSAASGCQISAAKHAGAKCCCGERCHCMNCGAHQQRSNDKQNSPTVPNDTRDLVKIGQSVAYLAVALTESGRVGEAASHVASVQPLQTLVAQHACLRV